MTVLFIVIEHIKKLIIKEQRRKMTVGSDNESLHSPGSIFNVDENRGGNDLTVKIPDSSDSRRSSKPVKLKRKNYEVGSKQKSERDGKASDQGPASLNSKSEMLSSYPLQATYQGSLKPASEGTHEKSIFSSRENPERKETCVTSVINGGRKITFPSSKGKSLHGEESRSTDMQIPGKTTLESKRTEEKEVEIVQIKDADVVHNDGRNNSKRSPVLRLSNEAETIQINIGDGKLRSSTLVSKIADLSTTSLPGGQPNGGDQRPEVEDIVDLTSKYEDIGSSSTLDDSQIIETTNTFKSNHPEATSARRDSRSREEKKSKRTPDKSRSPDRSSRRRRDSQEKGGRDRKSSTYDNQKRERKRSPARRGNSPRSRSPYIRNRSDYNRRRGLLERRRQLDRGRRGSFDNRRGRFGGFRGGGRGYAGRGAPPPRRFPNRRNDRNRSADRSARRRNNSPNEGGRSRSRDNRDRKDRKSKRSLKPSKQEIEKMEKELKKIDLMIEIRKTKKKTSEKLAEASDKKGDGSDKLVEPIQADVSTINVAMHSENSPLGQSLKEGVHESNSNPDTLGHAKVGGIANDKDEEISNQYTREVSELDQLIATRNETLAKLSASNANDAPRIFDGGNYEEIISDSENDESGGEHFGDEQEKEGDMSLITSSSDGDSETGSNKEDVKRSHSENSGKETEAVDDKEQNSSSDSEEESAKSSTASDASDDSHTPGSGNSDTENSESDSSDDSEPVKKRRSKKKKRKKRKHQSSDSDSESSELDSDASEKSSRKSKKKRKKKKKKKKSKRHSRKHRKDGDKIVMNESQFTAFLEKVKDSLRDEIVKEIQQPPSGGKEAIPSRKKGDDKVVVDSKDAEINYSSDELDIEMSTHHGFPTGIPLRKDEEELKELKGSDDNLEVFKVFKSDDELDDELEDELEEENWKRSRKKEKDSKRDSGDPQYSRSGKGRDRREGRDKIIRKGEADTAFSEETNGKSRKDVKDIEWDHCSKDEIKSRKRLSDHRERIKEDPKKRSRSEESKDSSRDRKSVHGEYEKPDVYVNKRRGSPIIGKDSSEKPNQYSKRSIDRHDVRSPSNKQPFDGIAIANQVRNDVYKLNDFWSGSAARKRSIDGDGAPLGQDDHSDTHKENNKMESGGGASGRWEAPFSDINNRLQRIADQKYPEDEHTNKRRKSLDMDKNNIEKRPLPLKHDGERIPDNSKTKELSPEGMYKDVHSGGRAQSGFIDKGKIKNQGIERRYTGKHEQSLREKEIIPGMRNADRDNERDMKRDIDRSTANSGSSSRSGDRKNDRNDNKNYSNANLRTDIPRDSRSRDSQLDRRYGANDNRRNNESRRNYDRKDDPFRRGDNQSKHEPNKERDSFRNKGNFNEDARLNRHTHKSGPHDDWSRRNESSYDKNKGHNFHNSMAGAEKHSNTTRNSRVGANSVENNVDFRDRHGKAKKKDIDTFSSFSSDSSDERHFKNEAPPLSPSFTRPERHYRGSKKK